MAIARTVVKSLRGVYVMRMFAMIILCVAVLCLATVHVPAPQGWVAIVLAVIALLSVCLKWSPI